MAHERISSTAAWADFSITSLKGIAVLLPIAGVILALWLKPVDVNFPELSNENVIGLLTGLIVIALFIERAVEVFLTPWRSTKSLKISKKVKYEKAILEKQDPDSASQLSDTESQLLDFKGRTRTIAFLIALGLGMTISASGVRGLATLMNVKECSVIFRALDVLLTGALLAGGADGLHKIVAVFTSFMEKSAERTKSA
jgi:hypothetical protein